jgi:hypothetical protein
VRPTTVVTACAAVLAPFYNWLFIVWLGKGLDGAAMALVALQLTSLLLLGSYVVYRNARWGSDGCAAGAAAWLVNTRYCRPSSVCLLAWRCLIPCFRLLHACLCRRNLPACPPDCTSMPCCCLSPAAVA